MSESLRPMDYTVCEILQARILEWVALPFSRGSSQLSVPVYMGLWWSPKMSIILYTENRVNGGPKRCAPHPEHVNRALSGKRVFGDVVKDLKLSSSRVRVTFNPIKRVLISNKRGHRGEAS